LASFWRRFMETPETSASRLVPETMTHFASKWYRQKKNDSDFWEFWGWWHGQGLSTCPQIIAL